MPVISLTHSKNINDRRAINQLIKIIPEALNPILNSQLTSYRIGVVSLEDCHVGGRDGGNEAWVYLKLAMLKGRTDETKTEVVNVLVDLIQTRLSHPDYILNISVYIEDFAGVYHSAVAVH